MTIIEKIGTFYLGKKISPREKETPFHLDSKQLTTHAVCVGMTGSGKTGLGIALLEEAGLDKIPALIIDPKGDLGNLLLTFPNLKPNDFLPWIDEQEAERENLSTKKYAEKIADTWKEGLSSWDESQDRIATLRKSVEMTIYTPASKAGIPLSVLNSFKTPPQEILNDAEAFRDQILSITSSLLGLLGIKADPIKSREHILISNIITYAWKQGKDLSLAALIQYIQKPPFQKIGALNLDTFFPSKERKDLSVTMNNLLASPGFQAWLQGEPLDIQKLLYTDQGKPRFAIISIAHLSESERMFFMTIFLNELLSWIRRQPGTSSLRAILYMDEIFGFFPSTSMPPSKIPMLTLLKQARAYGLGIILATQNPVDLDYKGLSNCGIWFIGKLQTERDKSKIMEGLNAFELDKMMAGIKKRVFMLRSIYEEKPFLFETRWTLSYLRGPLTLAQISRLTDHSKQPIVAQKEATELSQEKPIAPTDLPEYYGLSTLVEKIRYTPLILGSGKLHYIDSKNKIDVWREISILAPADEKDVQWENGTVNSDIKKQIASELMPNSTFENLPNGMTKNSNAFQKSFISYLYQNQPLILYKASQVAFNSKPEETEGEFRSRLALLLKEKRDEALSELDKKYSDKIQTLKLKISKYQGKAAETTQKALWKKINLGISFFGTLLAILLGKKLTQGSISQAGTTMRRAEKVTEDSPAVTQEEIYATEQRLEQLQKELEEEKQKIVKKFDPDNLSVETIKIAPRKSDITVEKIALVWWPVK